MKKIFSLLFSIAFLLIFISLFSQKTLAVCPTTATTGVTCNGCTNHACDSYDNQQINWCSGVYWTKLSTCPSGQTCSNGACVVTAPVVTSCQSGYTLQNGTCNKTCPGTCQASNAVPSYCGNSLHGAPDPSGNAYCNASTTGGHPYCCDNPACTSGAVQCLNGTTPQNCINGQWQTETKNGGPCASNQTCVANVSGAACQPNTCTKGTLECDAATGRPAICQPSTANPALHWSLYAACPPGTTCQLAKTQNVNNRCSTPPTTCTVTACKATSGSCGAGQYNACPNGSSGAGKITACSITCPPPPTCTLPQTNPYYTCSNNTCVANAACGTSSGGCTAAGGTCNTSGDTTLSFVIGIDGIGHTGDNANPDWTPSANTATYNNALGPAITVTSTFGSNQNPNTTTRPLKVQLFNTNNKETDFTGTITYDNTSSDSTYGLFTGTVDLGANFTGGSYLVKVSTDGHLVRLIPGVQTITSGKSNTLPRVNLVAGDVDNSNALTIQDYNILMSCIHDTSINNPDNGVLCATDNNFAVRSDLYDNKVIDSRDYNLFLREYSVQNGD